MIRYDIRPDELLSRIDLMDPTWRVRADARTKMFRRKRKFDDPSPIWSEIKEVFITLQERKCIFCERQFEAPDTGRIEYDLEHFRPKSSVATWPKNPATGKASERGYYWLAYDLDNYAAACKPCNSPLKSNYFPVGGRRLKPHIRPSRAQSEKAYLCYPIGEIDEDPEKLVTFVATTARPVAKSGFKRLRGQIIIDFFQLNDREELHRQRAEMLLLLGNSLKSLADGTADQYDAAVVQKCLRADTRHSSCLRAFKALWTDNERTAREVLLACKAYFSRTGGIPNF